MYARNYLENEDKQTFSRGEYNIPANYRGNAFCADEIPHIEDECENDKAESCDEITLPQYAPTEKPLEPRTFSEPTPPQDCESRSESRCESQHENEKVCKNERRGLLGGLLSRFDRGFELDDLLIIGLILILLNGNKDGCPENRDEIVILLAILLLGG